MYKDFYGFTRSPFALTADPQFLYASENYQDCLFYLLSGLAQDEGCLVLTGEIGTGKTFLLHTLLQRLDENTLVVFLVHTKLPAFDLLQYVSQELRIDITGQSKAALLLHVKDVLLSHAAKKETVLLIIDEAHYLSIDVLEELQLLTNFEYAAKKLLHIILVGQLQLEATLQRPELTALSQRIGSNCRLLPLDAYETTCYIEQRLAVAGVTAPLFTSAAMQEIFVCSRGIPRVINLLCHVALVLSFNDAASEIGRTIIQQGMQGLNLYTPDTAMSHPTRHPRDAYRGYAARVSRPRRVALVAGLVAVSLLGAGVVLHSALARRTLMEETMRSGPRPAVVFPHSAVWREPPLLPSTPVWREPPILPQDTSSR